MTTINNYKTSKKYRQWQFLYNCHSKRNVRKNISISSYNQKKCCSQKWFLTQPWHQRICRTQLWKQIYIVCEKKNYKQIITKKCICTIVLSALWKTINKLVITNFTKRYVIQNYWHGNHKKKMLTKRIPDTAVTSEDLSHTTMTKICEKNSDKNKYRYNCNCKISQNDKNILLQDIHHSILHVHVYTTLSIYK